MLKFINLKKALLISLMAGGFFAATAQTLPLDPAVRTGKLPNGFTYYIRHNDGPKNKVFFYLANKVGSVLESDDQRGLAHFLEHMSFNGTKHFPKNELVNYLQKAGVRFGADLNAYTSFDETVYQLPLPSDDPEILKNGIEIMHDWASAATLDAVEIDKERGVVLEEKRLGKGANERMERQYLPLIMNYSRYAERIPIGTEEVITTFKPAAIKRFYADWYRPDLQALIVVGDINVDVMEQTIKKKFADLKNPVNEKERVAYKVPLTGQSQTIMVTDPEMTETTAEIIMKKPGQPVKTSAQFREMVKRQLFNGMMGKRFTEIRQQADPPFLQAGAGINAFMGGLDSYTVSVTAKPGELEIGLKSVWREAERARLFGFTSTELDRAKASYLKQYSSALEEKNKTGSEIYVKEYLQYFLSGTATPGIDYTFNLVKKDLADITVGEINMLAGQLITTTDRDVLILAPEKDKALLPGTQKVASWFHEVDVETLQAYKDDVNFQPLLKQQPVPGKIISEQKNDRMGTTMLTLSNGIKVMLKPTGFKNDEISFSGFAAGGTSLYSDLDYQSATAVNAIPSFGAGNYSAPELTKFLSGKQLNVQPFMSERIQGVNGSAVKADLEDALQLLYAYFTEPRKDSLVFAGMIERSKAGLANRSNDPSTVFQDTISAVLSNYNLRRTAPNLEKLNQLSIDKAYRFYKERFSAGGFTFVFVGSIDTLTIRPLLEKYLGGLPASPTVVEAKDLYIHIPAGIIQKTVYKGSEQKAMVNLIFSGDFDYTMANKLEMDALKEALQIRLLERLREDESGVYTPSTRITTGKYPQGRFSLVVSFGCSPQNTDKLIASALDEINKLRINGPPQVNVDKFRAETSRSLESALSTNGFWLTYLCGQLQNKESITQIDDYVKLIDDLNPALVKDAANRYLSGKNYIKLVLLPVSSKVHGTE
jgi:zinc protease